MRGILSPVPGPSAIRILVGTHLLLLIQAALVAWSATQIEWPLRVLVGLVAVLALAGLVTAIRGLAGDDRQFWWRRRRDR
ncbi:hypothetical protein [Novosphingobium sp. LASN5T]|uniref:hypothetical protein n=1 Tax=Novosphingobium sp. LASN5T TaxID=2491021 RepID=UPI000F5F4E5C|nr:hypothetical protein [Novosphingobium sp. LASN5T]RQW46095.1 hypothetical protein EH199_01685 [Novosphingobium sp. LASN5T]